MKLKHVSLALVAGSLAFSSAAQALNIIEDSGNLQAFGFSVDTTARTIMIRETWGPGTSGTVRLLFEDPNKLLFSDWVVTKFVFNNTGDTWTSFGHELLQGDGSGSDDLDGLSFAQGSGIPRTSDVFMTLIEDELADRDFLNWFGGTVLSGQSVEFSYGLRDNGGAAPFFLSQTANVKMVPEPSSSTLLIAGFAGFAMFVLAGRRHRRPVLN